MTKRFSKQEAIAAAALGGGGGEDEVGGGDDDEGGEGGEDEEEIPPEEYVHVDERFYYLVRRFLGFFLAKLLVTVTPKFAQLVATLLSSNVIV